MLRIVAHFGSAAGLRHCVCTVCSGPICIFHGEWRMDCKTVGPHPVCTITDYRLERIETADRLEAERIAFRGRNRTGIVKICNSEMANIEKLARNVHYLYIREISVVAHRTAPAPTYIYIYSTVSCPAVYFQYIYYGRCRSFAKHGKGMHIFLVCC